MDSYLRRKIDKLAEEQVRLVGCTAFPVDPLKIAENSNIVVQEKPPEEKGASGWLVRSGNNFGILYATHIKNEGFQRFSISHELGHYFIEGHPEHVFRGGDIHASQAGFCSKDEIEKQADYFAASLLMPMGLFKKATNSFSDGLTAVKGLQTLCKASLEATAIRYVESTSEAIGVVISKGKLVQYSSFSDEFKEIAKSRLKRGEWLPKSSCTFRMNSSEEAVFSGESVEDEISADEWFAGLKGSISEEAIGLGTYGKTLTMLTLNAEDDEDEAPAWTPKFRR